LGCIGRGGRTCHGLGCYCFFLSTFYYFLISFFSPHPVQMLCESIAVASFLGTEGRALFKQICRERTNATHAMCYSRLNTFSIQTLTLLFFFLLLCFKDGYSFPDPLYLILAQGLGRLGATKKFLRSKYSAQLPGEASAHNYYMYVGQVKFPTDQPQQKEVSELCIKCPLSLLPLL